MKDLAKKTGDISAKMKTLQDEFTSNNEMIEKMSAGVQKFQADIRALSDKNHMIHGAVQAYMDAMKTLQPDEETVNG